MLIASMAHMLLSILGAAGEAAGLDRLLKANTSKKRTLSLFHQGLRWFQLVPNMPDERLSLLMAEFDALLAQNAVFAAMLAAKSE